MTAPALAQRDVAEREAPGAPRHGWRQDLTGWAFAAPFVILFGIFLALPILAAFALSFTSFGLRDLENPIGTTSSASRTTSTCSATPKFWKSLGNTVYFVVVGVPLTLALGLVIANALSRGITRFRTAFRVGYYLPVITSIVAIAVVWRFLLNPDVGLINMLLGKLGINGPDWLADPALAMPSIIAMAVWRNLGFAMVVFVAGMQAIPAMLYEAASIDGAGRWQAFRYVTLPMLRPTILFMLVITTIGYLQLFEEPFVMTDGGPLDATLSVTMYMYQQGFEFFHQGYASAIAYVLFVIVAIVAFLQFKFLRSDDVMEARAMTAIQSDPDASRSPPGTPASRPEPMVDLPLADRSGIVLMVGPFLWMVLGSLKPQAEFLLNPPTFLPKAPTTDNYERLFDQLDFPRFFFNSALVALVVTVGNVLFCPMLGYALAKLQWRGKRLVMGLVLATLMVPAGITLIPNFVLMRKPRAREHLSRPDPAVPRRAVRRLPDPPVHVRHPRRAPRGRPDRRGQRVADLLAGGHADHGAGPRDARDPDVPRQLEQLPLSARDGPGTPDVHAAGRARDIRHGPVPSRPRDAHGRVGRPGRAGPDHLHPLPALDHRRNRDHWTEGLTAGR